MPKIATKKPPQELSFEEQLVLEAAALRAQLAPLKELQKQYDKVRQALLKVNQDRTRRGINSPLQAPGWLVTFASSEIPSYTVNSYTKTVVTFTAMVKVSDGA